MANTHVLRLAPGRLGFFDPESHLSLNLSHPQGEIPADVPLPKDIKTALASGGLIDVNGTTNFRKTETPVETPKDSIPEPVIEVTKEPEVVETPIVEEVKPEITSGNKKGTKAKKE